MAYISNGRTKAQIDRDRDIIANGLAEAEQAKLEILYEKCRIEERRLDQIKCVQNAIVTAKGEPGLRQILTEVCDETGIDGFQIISDRRTRTTVLARHLFCYRAVMETSKGYIAIGKFLGDRDHTTILHGARAHCARNGLPSPSGWGKGYRLTGYRKTAKEAGRKLVE